MTSTSVQNLVDKTGISRYLITKALHDLNVEIGHHMTRISDPQMTKLEATFKAIKAGNKAAQKHGIAMKPAAKPAAKPKMAAKPAAKPAKKAEVKSAKKAAEKPAKKAELKPNKKVEAKVKKPEAKKPTVTMAAKPAVAKPAAHALKPSLPNATVATTEAPKLQDTDKLHE